MSKLNRFLKNVPLVFANSLRCLISPKYRNNYQSNLESSLTNELEYKLFKRKIFFERRSLNGIEQDKMEFIFRSSVYLVSQYIKKHENEKIEKIINLLVSELKNRNPENYDQEIIEAQELIVILYIIREKIGNILSEKEHEAFKEYIEKCLSCNYYANNWMLIRYTIQAGYDELYNEGKELKLIKIEIDKFIEKYYVGSGLWIDGGNSSVDLYSFWGFSYSLFWITKIYKDKKYAEILAESASYINKITSETEFPLFGRSKIYRSACLFPLTIFNNKDFQNKYDRLMKVEYEKIRSSISFSNFHCSTQMNDYSNSESYLWFARPLIAKSINMSLEASDIKNSFEISENRMLPFKEDDDVIVIKYLGGATNYPDKSIFKSLIESVYFLRINPFRTRGLGEEICILKK